MKIDNPPTNGRLIAVYLNLNIIEYEEGDSYYNKYHLAPNVRAFLSPSERLIGIFRSLPQKQKNFSILHEIGHFVLPGHATDPSLREDGLIITDEGKDLGPRSSRQLEIEANQFAADCLFQLERFNLRVDSQELNWDNIQSAAEEYDTSFEATARRWVEKSKQACALIAFNPINKQQKEPLEIMYTITSESFKNIYFERLVPGFPMGTGTHVYQYFYGENIASETELRVNIVPKGYTDFLMSLFSNSYRVFGLVTPLA